MDILRLSLLGGLLGLDGTSVGQFMVSRPIVTGAIVGWALGEPTLGLAIGAMLELYLIVSFPTGGSRFPEGSTATVVAVAAAGGVEAAGAVPLAIGVGLVWGQVGGASITRLRQLNSRLAPEPDDPSHGPRRIVAAHLGAIALDFLRGSVVTATGVWVGRLVVPALTHSWPLSPTASTGLLLAGGAVSAGILLRDLGGFRRRRIAFVAGLALGLVGASLL
jgi:mannose/fructose/N-acetylgalactosamine-specific phosphotransferase system component IIC